MLNEELSTLGGCDQGTIGGAMEDPVNSSPQYLCGSSSTGDIRVNEGSYTEDSVGGRPDMAGSGPEMRSRNDIVGGLRARGAALYDRFQHSGALKDINQAIACWKEAVSQTNDSQLERAGLLNNLGVAYRHRFERLGELADLDEAIGFQAQSVPLLPDGHPDKPGTLSNLGISYHTRFERLGKLADLNNAIEYGTQAVSLTLNNHAVDPGTLNNLGLSYLTRFERLGELVDLNKAVECGAQALSCTPDGDADKPARLNNLGSSYRIRFERLGQLVDLNKAVECSTQAVLLAPNGHADNPSMPNNLGLSCLARFGHLGDLVDLNRAIECSAHAISLTPDGHAVKPVFLSSLGDSYLARLNRLGELVDLNKAIECSTRAISLTPDGHPDKPRFLTHLGTSYNTRLQLVGEPADVNKAIECGIQAISLTSDDHAERRGRLSTLGLSYLTRFKRLGELEDLNKAIECSAHAVSLIPDGHPAKPSLLNKLGASHRTRFERFGEITDLNEAIECGIQAISLTPDGHAFKASLINNLGGLHVTRFELLGELVDLNKAIKCGVQAVSLTPDDHASKPGFLNNLGASYLTRSKRRGELTDLDKAIECGVQAVSIMHDADTNKPGFLNNLGLSYQTRFKRLGEVIDLNKAIEFSAEAISLAPDGHVDKPNALNSLALAYLARFERLGEPVDLDKSIECGIQAVSLTPNGHADKPSFLDNLGNSYSTRVDYSQAPSDLESAIDCYKDAAQSFAGPPFSRFYACRRLARLTSQPASVSSPYAAYQQAMDLLPQLIWIGTTLGRRYSLITDVGDFATEAAAYAISINDYELALEWLEAALADQLKEIGRRLEYAGSRTSSVPSLAGDEHDLDQEVSDRTRLALDWEVLLNKARSIAGFEDFLRPSKSDKLLGAAKSHPVAVLNVHKSRCDVLILRPHSNIISHISLTELSTNSAMAARNHLMSQVRQRKIGRLSRIEPLEKSLNDLWSSVLKPVLDFLGYTGKLPIEDLPRLTWCTTGLLSFLPLHAAGRYDGSQDNAFDLVVSSYTPTLSALLVQQSVPTSGGVLAVSQEHTPNLASLPCTKDELTIIQKYTQRGHFLQLQNEEATVDQVLDAMDRFSWVHLACHGSQDVTDPTQSSLHLHDGNLTLAMITKRSFTGKGLAFLSACQTAAGDKQLPEEAVHLAAGMLMAGFPSVIGTMWSIADEDGPKIADKVYASLLKDGGMNHQDAARALHQAVAGLRGEVGETCFERWAPFIHIGS